MSKYFCYVSLPSPPHPTKGEGEGLGLEDVVIAGSFDIGGYDCKLTQTLIQRGVCLQYVDDVMAPPPYPGKAFVIGNQPQISLPALGKAFVIGNLPQISLPALGKAFVIGNLLQINLPALGRAFIISN